MAKPPPLTPASSHADPGYLPDGRARYALDTAKEVHAAMSYFPRFRSKYTAQQASNIEAAIMHAAAKFGIHSYSFAGRNHMAKQGVPA